MYFQLYMRKTFSQPYLNNIAVIFQACGRSLLILILFNFTNMRFHLSKSFLMFLKLNKDVFCTIIVTTRQITASSFDISIHPTNHAPIVEKRGGPWCMRRCLEARLLHPAQCHALCQKPNMESFCSAHALCSVQPTLEAELNIVLYTFYPRNNVKHIHI